MVGLIVISFLLLLAGAYYLNSFYNHFYARTESTITNIADIKASAIANWKTQRTRDAEFLMSNTRVNELAAKLANNQELHTTKQQLLDELQPFLKDHSYDVILVDKLYNVLFSSPQNTPPPERDVFSEIISTIAPGDNPGFVSFYRNKSNNQWYLAVVSPLHLHAHPAPLYLIMRINPSYGLYDTFWQQNSVATKASSYFIFRKDDTYFTFLPSDTVHRKDYFQKVDKYITEGLIKKLMDDSTSMQTGTGFGGEKVFAALSPVGDTSWYVISQMDKGVHLQAISKRAWAVFIAGGIFLLSIVALGFVLSRQQQLRLLRMSHENELLLDDLINNQPSGIYRVSVRPTLFQNIKNKFPVQYIFVSKQHEVITGLSEKALRENPKVILDVIHPDEREEFYQVNKMSVEKIMPFKWDGRLIKNNQVHWVRFESVPRLNPPDEVVFTGVVIDITHEKELEENIRKRETFGQLITKLSSSFVNVPVNDYDETIYNALREIGQFSNTDRSYIFIWNQENNTLENTHEWTASGTEPQIQNLQSLPCEDIPYWMKKLNNFEPILIHDVSKLPGEWETERKILEPQGVKSLIVVPIISEEKLYGFVGFDSVKTHRTWKDYEMQMLSVFADMVYNALERKKAEQSLLESQQMLRLILDSIDVRVFWKDTNLKYKGCNLAFLKDAGLEKMEDIIGKDDYQQKWIEQAEQYRRDDLEVIKNNQPKLNFEEVQTTPHGGTKWLNTSKIPLRNSKGEVIGMLGTYQNITEKKLAKDAMEASEKRYRTLTENAFDGIYLLRNKSFEYVNQRFCEITGYSFEVLTDKKFDILSLFTPESRKKAEERNQARKQGQPIPSTYEMQVNTPAGEVRDIEISTNQLNEIGEENLILGIMRDITERKNNEALRNDIAIARKSAQFKQNFLANMSHEIRTPLTGVLGMIEILSKTPLNESQSDYINTLRLSTENLREIINQILDYSKIEAGKVKLKPSDFQFGEMINAIIKVHSNAFKKKNIDTNVSIGQEVPSTIKADEQRVMQILNNLLSNAVKFTDHGKIDMLASASKGPDNDSWIIKITVTDTGIGIAPQALESLFQPFKQVDLADTRNFEGTGLGLAISKDLAELMGGETGAKSTPGKGSTFWFTFVAHDASDIEKNPPVEKIQKVKSTTGLRILLAEDKEVNQKVVKLMLTAMGHKVTLAQNGHEAVTLFQPQMFDIILMDIQMPVMDGITAIRILREKHQSLPPVVGLSANAFEGDREKYMNLGMDEYLTKPLKSDELEKIINQFGKL